jgi:hypothetical protein
MMLLVLFLFSSPGSVVASSPCQMQLSTSTVAFCDSFNQAAGANDSRSGALNPTVWGVSEVDVSSNSSGLGDNYASGTNVGQGAIDSVAPVTANDPCGGLVRPPENVQICNGQLFDSVNDDGGQTVLAMYPRQPFDIAGRTGDVSFNVSDNTQGGHAAWPVFVYTDQPVPAPNGELSGVEDTARNSLGIEFDQVCDSASNNSCNPTNGCPNDHDVTVGDFFVTDAYALTYPDFTTVGCVAESTNPTVQNHVEIRISQSQVTVWASNPGSTSLIELAVLNNADLSFTRGLVWLTDDHYNGDKFGTQQSNTFGWSDLGFDGPILPRDLGFDVPVEGSLNGGAEQLGWATGGPNDVSGNSDPVTVATLPDTSANIAAASGALVEFTWMALDESVPGISLNGHAIATPAYPFPDADTYVWRTIAVPVPLSDVVAGANQITFENAPGGFANVDLILQGAGGVPTCLDPSDCSAVSSAPTPRPSTAPQSPTSGGSTSASPSDSVSASNGRATPGRATESPGGSDGSAPLTGGRTPAGIATTLPQVGKRHTGDVASTTSSGLVPVDLGVLVIVVAAVAATIVVVRVRRSFIRRR